MDKKYILFAVVALILFAFFWPKESGWESYPAVAELQGQNHYESMVCSCIGIAIQANDCKSCVKYFDCYGISTSCSLDCNKKVDGTWQKISCLVDKSNATISTDKESCESLGGNWGPIGLFPEEVCVLPTSDGGKICTDSSECEAKCAASLTEEQYNSLMTAYTLIQTTGFCTAWKTSVGCNAYVVNGTVSQVLCVD